MSLTLLAQIKPSHIEGVHLLRPEVQETSAHADMSSNSIKAQTFIDRSFAALQDLLQAEPEGDQQYSDTIMFCQKTLHGHQRASVYPVCAVISNLLFQHATLSNVFVPLAWSAFRAETRTWKHMSKNCDRTVKFCTSCVHANAQLGFTCRADH